MLLSQLNRLEEDTKQAISKAQMERDSKMLSEIEYEERYEAIMQKYRMETERIIRESKRFNF